MLDFSDAAEGSQLQRADMAVRVALRIDDTGHTDAADGSRLQRADMALRAALRIDDTIRVWFTVISLVEFHQCRNKYVSCNKSDSAFLRTEHAEQGHTC